MRKDPLKSGYLYHICSKSISGYIIFRSEEDYSRMKEMLRYYRHDAPPFKFSLYEKLLKRGDPGVVQALTNKDLLVDIIAYCIMPTHFHLILCQLKENGISMYLKNVLDSYTRYFNIKYHRKGPLWEGRFKSILIVSDEQLLHLTRYIHLNPTSDNLVAKAQEWRHSSYNEFLNNTPDILCSFFKYLEITPEVYRKFVEERKDYQKRLAMIKHLLLELE